MFHRQPCRSFTSSSLIASSPLSTLELSFFRRFDTVLAMRSVTSFWKTYITAKTKNASVANPGRETDLKIREISDLLLLNAYSVSLAASVSPLGRRNMVRTAGMKVALVLPCQFHSSHGKDDRFHLWMGTGVL